MNARSSDLPDFLRPPLVEVVLSLQFEPIKGLTAPMIGLLWSKFRHHLPEVEEHPPLASAFERFDVPVQSTKVGIVFDETPPVPRVWFLNTGKTQLIQVQQDRFIHNWRKVTGQESYPRYEKIRADFEQEVGKLTAFLEAEKLGALKINQCEVTYVNHIEQSGVWKQHGEIGLVLRHWVDLPKPGFLQDPEDVAMKLRYVIRDEIGVQVGRLNVVLQPVRRTKDNSPMFALNLTARGKSLGEDVAGAFRFLDLGREWIVRGFGDLTTREMQDQVWGRIQ